MGDWELGSLGGWELGNLEVSESWRLGSRACEPGSVVTRVVVVPLGDFGIFVLMFGFTFWL